MVSKRRSLPLVALLATAMASPMLGQHAAGYNSSPNVKLVAHIPLAGVMTVSDIEVEQELSRPYAYVSRGPDPIGFDVISLRNPERAERVYSWAIEDPELHDGRGVNGKYFKLNDRYYYVQAVQLRPWSLNRDLSTIVFDVTGLPDTSTVREVGRIRVPQGPGGAHNLFLYKHSTGRTFLFNNVQAPADYRLGAHVYDMERFLAGDRDQGFVGGVPLPGPRGDASGYGRFVALGYHDAYVAYDPATRQDRFYGGGPETAFLGGNFVYDITDIENPKLLATVIAQPSMQSGGHTFVPTPDAGTR